MNEIRSDLNPNDDDDTITYNYVLDRNEGEVGWD